MLIPHTPQFKFQMCLLEDLVPQDHLLRLVDQYIDFTFIKKLTYHLYCHDNGRPAIDPVVLFKMLFVGYIYGIRSERRLVEEFQVNLAYRWFIGYDLDDPIPNHSTFSQNRRRRFSKNAELEQEIFDQIVEQAVEHGLIDGHFLYTDSTHIKANANKRKFQPVQVKDKLMEYLKELQQDIDQQRQEIGKEPFNRDDDDPSSGTPSQGKEHEVKQSTTDPESGFMTRDGKPQGFFYLDHRTVDGCHNLIVDCHVTAANINDARPYPSRLERIWDRFNFDTWCVGVDAGYKTAYIAKFLRDHRIYGVAGYRRKPHPNKDMFYPREFKYDAQHDIYVCPFNKVLTLKTVDRRGYRQYKTDVKHCESCPLKQRCTLSKQKIIHRHIWQDYVDELDAHRLTPQGKKIYKRRKETVERSFADSKEMHGLRYTRFRSLAKVRGQCLLVAACQNMKKISLVLHKQEKVFGTKTSVDPDAGSTGNGFIALLSPIFRDCRELFLKRLFREIFSVFRYDYSMS